MGRWRRALKAAGWKRALEVKVQIHLSGVSLQLTTKYGSAVTNAGLGIHSKPVFAQESPADAIQEG